MLGSALWLLLGLILLGTLSRYYCAHSMDRQQAIITVPACSPSATKTLVKLELWQQHCEATGYDTASGLRRPLLVTYAPNGPISTGVACFQNCPSLGLPRQITH